MARAVVKCRSRQPIETSEQLCKIIYEVFPRENISYCAKVFQSLRMEVNNEVIYLLKFITIFFRSLKFVKE